MSTSTASPPSWGLRLATTFLLPVFDFGMALNLWRKLATEASDAGLYTGVCPFGARPMPDGA